VEKAEWKLAQGCLSCSMAFTVYRAGAGSGKTFTLVREYLRLALSGREADGFRHILAITFTNKAAGEMKSRVLQALAELSGQAPTQRFGVMAEQLQQSLGLSAPELRERSAQVLQAMLHRYQQLSIGTIDSFVARLARQFASDLMLDSAFEIVLDQDLILQQTVDKLLARLGSDEALTRLLVNFAREQMQNDKSWNIRRELLEHAAMLQRDHMRRILPQLQRTGLSDFETDRQRLRQRAEALCAPVIKQAQQLLARLQAAGVEQADVASGSKGPHLFWEKVAQGITDANVSDTHRKTISSGKWYSGKASPTAKAWLTAEADWMSQQAQSLVDAYEAMQQELQLVNSILKKQYAMATLAALQQAYENWIEENAAAPLSSLYFRIADLLSDASTPYIYERLGNRYRHFLIDEFQDTSVLQWQNMLPLIENGLAGENDSLVVGDAKQSIYRWRSGEAEQFVRLPYAYGEAADSPLLIDAFRLENLERNFRSHETVIQFNNAFFSRRCLNKPGLLTDFYEGLEQSGGKAGGLVRVELLPKAENKAASDVLRYQRIVTLVSELQAQGVPLGEVAILVRKGQVGSDIALQLLEAGYPVVSSDSLLLQNQPIIRLVLQCWRWLADSKNDVARESCLHEASVLLGLERTYALSFEQQLAAWLGSPPPRESWRLLPLNELSEQILAYFGLVRHSNPFVLRMLDIVAERSKYSPSLSELLDWWEGKGQEAALQMPENAAAIRIMTYHKSKGLEFGVVIVADVDERKKQLGQADSWISTPLTQSGLALVGTNDLKSAPQPYQALYEHEDALTEIDYLNNIYVAFTRAVGALYIFGEQPGGESRSFIIETSFSKTWPAMSNLLSQTAEFVWETGQIPAFEHRIHESLPAFNQHRWQNWRERIALQSHFEGEGDEHIALSLGKVTHDLLARLKDVRMLESSLAQMLAEGLMRQETADLLLPVLRRLLQQPEVAPWFAPGLDVRNELSLLSPNGEQLRPDRVVITGKQAQVLEFKTGTARPEHQQQLDRYLSLLAQMGYEASGQLVYVDLSSSTA
jgi:ATP-dependent exoDNAse (exonuclease V) beta subunit